MRFRGCIKYLVYGPLGIGGGSFPYEGCKVYFPPRSVIFRNACAEGLYEAGIRQLLLTIVEPGSWYFDIGANIGLLSVPMLNNVPDVNVLSAEPSPSTFPFLKRSWESSPWKSRWHIDSRAVSATTGTVTFSIAEPGMGAFDGMQDTLRAGPMRKVDVPSTTLDDLWKERGMPRVSAIKIDIEGAETLALQGGEELIAAQRPFLILEWNRMNLAAYEFPVGSLATWAQAHNYIVRSLPTFQNVTSPQDLAFHSLLSESYLLSPAERMPHSF